MCGASGATISTKGSATSRGVVAAPFAVTWLFSSVSFAIAVLNRRFAMSVRTESMVRCSTRRVSSSAGTSSTRSVPGLFVDDQTPQPLQEAVDSDDRARLPRSLLIERAGEHLVQPQRVGAVGRVVVVGRDAVLQALAHLPHLAPHLDVAEEVVAVALLDRERVDVHATRVLIGRGEDVALVVEAAVRLERRGVPEVEQHLVPEPRVEQVQHRVLDTADVEVDASGIAGPLGPIQ